MIRKNIPKVLVTSLVIFLVLIVVLVLVKRYIFSPRSTPLCKDCNVLLISLDTCGAKHMSTYGYERDTTPNLTALAKEGVLFENMHSNATWTLPSHVSIFTGLYPMVHNMITEFPKDMDKNIPLLPEILKQHGYETYFYAIKNERTFPPKQIYNRGITQWTEDYSSRNYEALPEIINKLDADRGHKKKFIFFHSFACHSPYFIENQPLLYATEAALPIPLKIADLDMEHEPTEEYIKYLLERMPKGLEDGDFKIAPDKIRRFLENLKSAPDLTTKKQIYNDAINQNVWGEQAQFGAYYEKFFYWKKIDPSNGRDVEYIKALYDQQMHSVDETILKPLNIAKNNGVFNNTIVIITADHGEEFMEHGELMHTTLYDYNTQVPLVVLIPGVKPQVIQEHVQSVDITPTILDVVGINNTYAFNGKSLLPLLVDRSLGKRLIIAEGNNSQKNILSIRESDWKLFVLAGEDNTVVPFMLYNTKQDASEQINVLTDNMGVAKKMIQEYTQLQGKKFQSQ